MADNVDVTPGSGKTIAADDVGGVLYPRGKVTLGADGAASTDLEPAPQPVNKSMPVCEAASTAVKPSAQSIGTTATQLASSALANRRAMVVQNLGTTNLFVGDATVTTANGIRIVPGGNFPLNVGAAVAVYAISASGSNDVRILELA